MLLLPPIFKTIQISRARHAGHCWRGKYVLINNVLLWTSPHRDGQVLDGELELIYISTVQTPMSSI